jgi:hypothetical protein
MKTGYSMLKRQLVIATIGVSGAFACSSAFADGQSAFPSAADETTPSMTTRLSLDNFTGGYKGWGPMANMGADAAALAEVSRARDLVWVANAPLRAPYQLENIGATKAEAAGGTVRFDSNDPR